jgi:mono/diheme cytochrome c family protein
VQRASRERPETTLEELERGRALYLSRCTACHQPIAPEKFSAAEWPAHVVEMQERARLKPEDVDLIQLYLVTMAAPPASSTSTSE